MDRFYVSRFRRLRNPSPQAIEELLLNLSNDFSERDLFGLFRNMNDNQLTQVIQILQNRVNQINQNEQPELYNIIERRRRLAILTRRELERGSFEENSIEAILRKRRRDDDEDDDNIAPREGRAASAAGLSKSVIMKGKRIYIN